MSESLPPCGLYKTLVAHPERGEQVPAKRLLYFHNHSSLGTPMVLLPKSNAANRWTFQDRGFSVQDERWCHTLIPMRAEGFYTIGETFHTSQQRTIVEGQIIQLGYNRDAEPIVFFPTIEAENNALVFPTQGMKIPDVVYAALRPVDLRGPFETPDGVH